MMYKKFVFIMIIMFILTACHTERSLDAVIYETSASGNKLTKISPNASVNTKEKTSFIKINPEENCCEDEHT